MTSEAKGYCDEVVDNPVKYLCKKFHKNNMTGFCFTSFQSNYFKRHDQHTKMSVKDQISKIIFGHLMTSEVKDHFYKVEVNLMKYL